MLAALRVLYVDTMQMLTYSAISMSYELELETATNICFKNFPHNREGLNAALSLIEKNKSIVIAAKITSSRDGIVFVK